MPLPQLYKWYDRDRIISFFGSEKESQSFCNGQWLVFPGRAVACLSEIGEGTNAPHFESGSRFCWVADQPYRVNEQSWSYFVPAQVLGSTVEKYPIYLFARPLKAERYLYAGELSPSHVQQSPGRNRHGMAWFGLKPTLPSEFWLQLGGLRLGNLDFAAVDRALDRLRYPMTVEDRLGVLEQLVDYWHGPIRPEDGMNDAEIGGVPLPLPLRWWYRWAGKRREIMSRENHLFIPRASQENHSILGVRNGRLIFYAESQGVYQWCTLPEGDDPAVFGRWEGKGRWAQEKIVLSEHLILMCLFEAVTSHAKYGASIAWLEENKFNEIIEHTPPLAIRPWRWLGMRFFVGQGAFAWAAENVNPKHRKKHDGEKRFYSVHIAAKTEDPLQFLKPFLDDKWEYIAL